MSRSAERIAKLREKLAKLEGEVLVVHVFGRKEPYYIGTDEAVRKERQRREAAPGSRISTRAKRHKRSRSSTRQRGV